MSWYGGTVHYNHYNGMVHPTIAQGSAHVLLCQEKRPQAPSTWYLSQLAASKYKSTHRGVGAQDPFHLREKLQCPRLAHVLRRASFGLLEKSVRGGEQAESHLPERLVSPVAHGELEEGMLRWTRIDVGVVFRSPAPVGNWTEREILS